MATFSGNAAGYRVDFLANGKVRVIDIDDGDGDTGSQILSGEQSLVFNDKSYALGMTTDIRVNTTTLRQQTTGAIATLEDGGYIVTWAEWEYGVGASAFCSQRYDASGNKVGSETRETSVAGQAITGLSDGGYIMVWVAAAGDGSGIFAQRYDAAGNEMGGTTQISSSAHNSVSESTITELADGSYVITWTSNYGPGGDRTDIYARRYDASGNALGDETLVNTTTDYYQRESTVTALTGGGYVVIWSGRGEGDHFGIYSQRFDAAGNAVGGETQVNVTAPRSEETPAAAALEDGGYIVVWRSEPERDNGNGYGIYAQRFDADGNKVGGETHVNTHTDNYQSEPSIAVLKDGGYIVVWESAYQDGDGSGIYAQRFDADGNKVGAETLINQYTDSDQSSPLITALDNGGYVITWNSIGQDGYGYGVYSRYFDADGNSKPGGLTLTGTAGDDVINGGAGAQMLHGKSGDDTLDGGSGDDHLFGGTGDNWLNGSTGQDVLRANTGNDVLIGGDGDDNLDGGEGNNTLSGGSGNDSLFVESSGDNVMNGGAGDDVLEIWGGGNNTLNGGKGNDYLGGGYGADLYVFDSRLSAKYNVDQVRTFDEGNDVIQLDNAIFKKLGGAGTLDAGMYVASADAMALDADDYILFDFHSGNLYYDADGNGAGARIKFASLGDYVLWEVVGITAESFEVI